MGVRGQESANNVKYYLNGPLLVKLGLVLCTLTQNAEKQ